MRNGTLPPRALEHLKASGLTAKDAETLELRWLSPEEVARVCKAPSVPVSGLGFPYHTADGADTGFLRVRLLPDPRAGETPPGFRYLQPTGSGARAYLPRLRDWESVQTQTSQRVLITEGEKKAAAACKAGLPTIGLGGVWSFGVKDLGIDLLPEIEAIGWKDRPAIVAFDSDWGDNKDVRKASLELARRLQERGAAVSLLQLPAGPHGEKVGLDDYLVAHGARALRELIDEATPLDPAAAAMEGVRRRFVLVRNVPAAWDRDMEALFSRSQLKDAFPDENVTTLGPTGRPRTRTKVEAWWEDPRKTAVDRQVLRPGEPEITRDGNLNLFRGWGTEPEEGDTSVWEELLEILVSQTYARQWLERWLAYPLQYPGTKLHQCVFVYGGQGVGKTALGLVMTDIYGPSGRVVQDRELFHQFNGWLPRTLFALGDDLSFDERRKSRSVMKHLVDSEKIEVNEKYIPSYSAENRCNFYLTSNNPSALPVDPNGINRRFLIIEAPEKRPRPRSWYTGTLDRWRKAGGARAVHHRLLHLHLGSFHPKQDAPSTDAKHVVVQTARTDLEGWLEDSLLEATPHQLAEVRELHTLYVASMQGRAATAGIGTFTGALRAVAAPLGEHKIGDRKVALWAIRDAERWRRASEAERVRQYRLERGQV